MNVVEPIRNLDELKKIECYLSQKNKRDFLIFLLGINWGLRISDILSLNVKDVKNKNNVVLRERKTGKNKKIPINSKLKSIIDEFIKYRHEDEPLFLSKNNNRMERTQCYRIINSACQNVGINLRVGTHTLRKTFGYHYYKKFKDIVMLQKILNHSTPEITLRYIGIEQETIENSYNMFIL